MSLYVTLHTHIYLYSGRQLLYYSPLYQKAAKYQKQRLARVYSLIENNRITVQPQTQNRTVEQIMEEIKQKQSMMPSYNEIAQKHKLKEILQLKQELEQKLNSVNLDINILSSNQAQYDHTRKEELKRRFRYSLKATSLCLPPPLI